MKRKGVSKKIAKTVANVATIFLQTDANSASSIIVHQPKAPKELARFKKSK